MPRTHPLLTPAGIIASIAISLIAIGMMIVGAVGAMTSRVWRAIR